MRELPDNWRSDKGSNAVQLGNNYGSNRSQLYPALQYILDEVRRELVKSSRDGTAKSSGEIEGVLKSVTLRLGFELTPNERDEILGHLDRDNNDFGPLQALVDDPEISDIIVRSYTDIDVQRGRENFRSGVRFACEKSYEAFVERLLQRAGSTYSTKKPIADGMIDSYARVHAVHSSLCDIGPYLTIRLNRFDIVSPEDLVKKEMLPNEIVEYLKETMRVGLTVMVVGEVGTGKTTLTRAIASLIPLSDSILVIEDTPEIKLAHPHVRYIKTRGENSEGEGRIPPSQCIRAGMRMAMNRIVFGEIRDAEAAEAFIDVCASGHPGVSTIHGRSIHDCITRLELFLGRAQPSVGKDILIRQISGAINVLVYVNVCSETKRRRVIELKEISGVSDGVISARTIFSYKLLKGTPSWELKCRVSSFKELGFNYELNKLANVLSVGGS
jgi:pilus assembly protein CpaF